MDEIKLRGWSELIVNLKTGHRKSGSGFRRWVGQKVVGGNSIQNIVISKYFNAIPWQDKSA